MDNGLAQLKVLVVEDQAESRGILRDMLSEMGITQVFEVDDGNAGLKFVNNAPDFIDLILCDWNMPSMSGIDFLQTIRGEGINIPFLMTTGRGDQLSVVQAKNHGVNGYIRKPFTPAQVEAKLRAMLGHINAA